MKILKGDFEVVDGQLSFNCKTKGVEFNEVLIGITKLRDECQRQIDQRSECPFYDEKKDKIKNWNDVTKVLPGDHGRYWVYVEEIGELGLSHFEWNCSYDPETKVFSDNHQRMNVTHWTELMGSPE